MVFCPLDATQQQQKNKYNNNKKINTTTTTTKNTRDQLRQPPSNQETANNTTTTTAVYRRRVTYTRYQVPWYTIAKHPHSTLMSFFLPPLTCCYLRSPFLAPSYRWPELGRSGVTHIHSRLFSPPLPTSVRAPAFLSRGAFKPLCFPKTTALPKSVHRAAHVPQLVEEADGLDGLAESHLVGKDGGSVVPPVPQEPVHTLDSATRNPSSGHSTHAAEIGESGEEKSFNNKQDTHTNFGNQAFQ